MTESYQGDAGSRYFEIRARRREAWIQEVGADFFRPFVAAGSTVLDFGCGTGEILQRIDCTRRLGIDVNEPSRLEANKRGIEVFESLADLPSASVDTVISHHALEHTADPAAALTGIRRVLRIGGQVVIVVPAENPRSRYSREWWVEPNRHLFSWTPLTLGNLMSECGLVVDRAYIREFGYSRYLRPIESIPGLYPLARSVLARMFDRYHSVCVARRGEE